MVLDILNTKLWALGRTDVTVASVLIAIAVFLGALTLSWLFRKFVDRLRERSPQVSAPAFYVVGQVGRYIIVFIGVLVAASTMGLDFSSLSLFAGAIGIGVGLGVQDVFRDFVAGLILLFDRSIEVGDFIEIETGVTGEVKTVGARATTILTNDNVDVLVPNSLLLTGKLTNWTRNRATRRIHVPFSVAYGSDKEQVRAAAIEAAQSVPFTLPDTETRRAQVWLTKFGDSSLDFELVVWPTLEAVKRPGSMMAAYSWALDDALRKHGIEIPFPQQDLRIRSFFGAEEKAGLSAWRGERIEPERKTPEPAVAAHSINDAAREIAEKQEEKAQKAAAEGLKETAAVMDEARKADIEDRAGD
ncbi:MAG: mechanosensitive ion channel [Alphaproteobacteria bacterium]|nr:mechanosensitive ion channel [Alphaproteobacteria bacterium]